MQTLPQGPRFKFLGPAIEAMAKQRGEIRPRGGFCWHGVADWFCSIGCKLNCFGTLVCEAGRGSFVGTAITQAKVLRGGAQLERTLKAFAFGNRILWAWFNIVYRRGTR